MKKIETLVDDIYAFVDGDLQSFVGENLDEFKEDVGEQFARRFLRDNQHEVRNPLRMSALGTACFRKLWYQWHHPTEALGLNPSTRLKFFFGDVIESILLRLAEDAGHLVQGKQDELVLYGVKGHRDAVIDGVTVDCKSASSRSFDKFKKGLTPEEDGFGYLKQLESYVAASLVANDPLVLDFNRGAFLVFDKQHGHICLDIHNFSVNLDNIHNYIDGLKWTVESLEIPPRHYQDEPDGKSGNRKLGTACSYCDFKEVCWPGLRTSIYSNGPRYLTQVVRTPDVYESTS